nr:MAG TPA: Ubiquitin-like protein [Crassvirales sp.]
METVIQKPKLLELIKRSSTFKLTVTEELERKIRYYLDRFPNTEYSGTLFYRVTGSFEEMNLEVTAFDFLLQDIGTSTYTEFNMSPDVVAYMVDNPELLDENVYQGLMHSHHTMGAFFSGTDDATLREEGSDRTHFLSLIIDTRGTYQAAITRVVEEEMTATGSAKFITFNEQEANQPISYTFKRKRLESFMLNVQRPQLPNPYLELSQRIEEVQRQKAEAAKKAIPATTYGGNYGSYGGYGGYGRYRDDDPYTWPAERKTPATAPAYQATVGRDNVIPINKAAEVVPPVEEKEQEIEEEPASVDYSAYVIPEDILMKAARELLSGSITETLDGTLEEISEAMVEKYKARFPDIALFEAWVASHVEFIVYYTETYLNVDDDTQAALLANALSDELAKLPANEYVLSMIGHLENYVI